MKYFFFVLLLANVLLLLWEINTGALHQELDPVPPVREMEGAGQIRLLSEITRNKSRQEPIPIMDKTVRQHAPLTVEKDAQDENSIEQPEAMAKQEGDSADSELAEMPQKSDETVQESEPTLTAGSQPSIGISEKIAPLAKLSGPLERPVQASGDAQAMASGSSSVRNELSSTSAGIRNVPEDIAGRAVSGPAQAGEVVAPDDGPTDENDAAMEKPLDGGSRQEVGASENTVADRELAVDQPKPVPGPAAMQHSAKPEKIQIKPVISASSSYHDVAGIDAMDNPPAVLSCYEIGPFPDAEMLQAGTTVIATEADSVENFSSKQKIPSGYVVLYPAAETFEQSLDNYQRLKKQGYNDLWLFRRTAWRGAVSMGIYSNENRARRIAQRLLDKGMNVRVKPIYKRTPQHFLRVTSEKSGLQALQKAVADLKKQVPGLQLKETTTASCNNNR